MTNTIKAGLWMLGGVMSFTTMAVAGRELASELDTFEIMMYRSMIGLLIVLSVAKYSGSINTVSRQRLGLHFIRNVCHFTGQNLWFFALALIPLAQVFAFEFSTPIWVALLAPFFLGERLTRTRLISITLGFIGIIIVAQPGTITVGSGVIAAALCAVAFAGTFIATKLLSSTDTTTSILFWLTAMQLVFGVVCATYDGDLMIPSLAAMPFVFAVALAGLFGHFCLTTALKLAPVMLITPVDFLRLPLIAFIGAMFYNEALNVWIFVGASLVFGANFFNIWSENKAKKVSST